ncbi:uncharacterized protein LOC143442354 [Arvicanthis niloticus]|uniref:uncharacterized protein LOC143442354 n=1 Tax=Arvicanthis niloticus TaxID=61156 RepID=UPI00403C54BE
MPITSREPRVDIMLLRWTPEPGTSRTLLLLNIILLLSSSYWTLPDTYARSQTNHFHQRHKTCEIPAVLLQNQGGPDVLKWSPPVCPGRMLFLRNFLLQDYQPLSTEEPDTRIYRVDPDGESQLLPTIDYAPTQQEVV